MFLVGTDQMAAGKYTRTRQKNRQQTVYVMAGGDLSEPTLVRTPIGSEREASCHFVQKEKH
jgi:hypothetical protein